METAPEGLTATMIRAYRAPRAVMARLLPATTEGRALAWLFAACALCFIANVPDALERARRFEIDESAALAAFLFGFLFVMPLMVYGLAAVAHLVARLFGARPGFLKARVALFWSLLLAAPLGVLLAAGRVIFDWLDLSWPTEAAGALPMALWVWLFANGFAEAEGIRGTWRVAAASGLVFAVIVAALSMLTRGAPVAG